MMRVETRASHWLASRCDCSLREASAPEPFRWWRPGQMKDGDWCAGLQMKTLLETLLRDADSTHPHRPPRPQMPSVSPNACRPFLHTQLKQNVLAFGHLSSPPPSGQITTRQPARANLQRRRQRAPKFGPPRLRVYPRRACPYAVLSIDRDLTLCQITPPPALNDSGNARCRNELRGLPPTGFARPKESGFGGQR